MRGSILAPYLQGERPMEANTATVSAISEGRDGLLAREGHYLDGLSVMRRLGAS